MSSISDLEKAYLFLFCVLQDMFNIRLVLDKVSPPTPQRRITLVGGDRAPSQPEVRVDREDEGVEKP